MGAHEALNFAQLLGGKATAAGDRHVMQPDLGAAGTLVDMDVWWFVGLMAIKVEAKAIDAQDCRQLQLETRTSMCRPSARAAASN